MNRGLLVASALTLGVSSVALARPAASDRGIPELTPAAAAALDDLQQLGHSLSADQRAALAGVHGDTPETILDQVDAILTPRQQARFDRATRVLLGDEEVAPTDGGWYLAYGCFFSSKVGLVLNVVGVIGCPSDETREAASLSWGASIFASSCVLEGASSCELAMNAAYFSASLWYYELNTCSVADTAYYSELITYRSCGGPRGGEDPETPTPSPIPVPTPAP